MMPPVNTGTWSFGLSNLDRISLDANARWQEKSGIQPKEGGSLGVPLHAFPNLLCFYLLRVYPKRLKYSKQ